LGDQCEGRRRGRGEAGQREEWQTYIISMYENDMIQLTNNLNSGRRMEDEKK
jgi:hypothetical protein